MKHKKILCIISGGLLLIALPISLLSFGSHKKQSDYAGMKVVKTFNNGRKLYYDPQGGSTPYVLEGNPDTKYRTGVTFVDNDADLETELIMNGLYGGFTVDVRNGWKVK